MSDFPADPKKTEAMMSRYRRTFAKEESQFGYVSDGSGHKRCWALCLRRAGLSAPGGSDERMASIDKKRVIEKKYKPQSAQLFPR